MSLFKRLLLSLFPDHFGGTMGPASMFLGLVNAKHFFTVITKRMVENPKLNLFDVGLDPVEVKIGFGDHTTIKPKDMELYFSYCVCANLNGYKFYNPTNLAALVSIALSQYFVSYFPKNKKGTDMFMILLLTINIVSYVFAARIKIFPHKLSKKESFNWFIDLFFNYYKFIASVYDIKLTKKALKELQSQLLVHTDLFFGLYYLYKHINTLFATDDVDAVEYYGWLFADELKKSKGKNDFVEFQNHSELYVHDAELSPMEDKLLDALMPAEILIKLLFNWEDVFLIAEYVAPKLFPVEQMDVFLHSFLQSDSSIEAWMVYLTDHKNWKTNFFEHLKKMIMMKFHKGGSETDDLEEILSSINDGQGGFLQIPESLRKEGVMMDRILNFYVGLLGSLRIGRGDSYFLRMFRPGLLQSVLKKASVSKRFSIHYYSALLHQYGKNQYFYRAIFDGVRSGKSSFMLPYIADVKEVYNNATIVKHLDEMTVAVLLQDLLTKDIKLSLHQERMLTEFQQLFAFRVSSWITYNPNTLLEVAYSNIDALLSKPVLVDSLVQYAQDQDIKNLKEALYTLDFWIQHDAVEQLSTLHLKAKYADSVILGIASTLRETLSGLLFLLYAAIAKQEQKKIDLKLDRLLHMYIIDVLNLSPDYSEELAAIITTLYTKYRSILELRSKIDDNRYFLEVGVDCWLIYSSKDQVHYTFSAEDVLRFRGYLKHVTYYNKRYVVPKL